MINWNALRDAEIGSRLVVWIGPNPESSAEVEKMVIISSAEDFDCNCISPYRADLIVINQTIDDLSNRFLNALPTFVHDDGAIWTAYPQTPHFRSVLTSLGFYPHDLLGLFKRTPQTSPSAYDASYLARWGSTNFMGNWQSASEQILAHAPQRNRDELRILDVGSFNGYIMESLRRAGVRETFGVEISFDLAVKNSVNRYHLPATRVTDFLSSQLPSGYFDMTLAMEILEHIPTESTSAFISELRRVTSDHGVVLISASDDWDADPTHVNCRSRPDWYFQFAKNGLFPFGSQIFFPGFNSFVLRKAPQSIRTHFYRIRYGLQASGLLNFLLNRERPIVKPERDL